MTQTEWSEFLEHLADAETSLRNAWDLMDGTVGFTDGGEFAYLAAKNSIVALREVETDWWERAR